MLTVVAAASRMPPPGRPAGAATTLGVLREGSSGSSARRLGLLRVGAPWNGGPLGARVAGGVAVLGRTPPALGRRPPPSLASALQRTDQDIAAMFGSMFALPPGTIQVVLNIDVPDRALTAVYIACLEQGDALDHPSRLRDAISFAIKRAFVAAARTPDPYMAQAIPGGQVFHTSPRAQAQSAGPHRRPGAFHAHGQRSHCDWD